MVVPIVSPKKLIEVALPLDVINAACTREKSIRHGHPSTMHLWWARRPLAAARAVIFAQLVNDPAGLWELQNPGRQATQQQRGAFTKRRRELFDLLKQMVLWENTSNDEVLDLARREIRRSWREVCELNRAHPEAAQLFNPDILPGLHDPFAGGGTIPLEAQRLGLAAVASDLNPVAVLINKAMIEIPSCFAGRAPVSSSADRLPADEPSGHGFESIRKSAVHRDGWKGCKGLATDVGFYGAWIREQARKRIGHLYPRIEVNDFQVAANPHLVTLLGQQLTVIAWIWVRTVKSPNPAFAHVDVPLASTFVLSDKKGKEAFIDPIVDGDSYRFVVRHGPVPSNLIAGTKLSRGANFSCLLSQTPIEPNYIKAEGTSRRIGARLMAVIAEGPKGRVYLSPSEEMERLAKDVAVPWRPDLELPNDPRNFWTLNYGLTTFGDVFTARQLLALNTFSELVAEVRDLICKDAMTQGFLDDGVGLEAGGTGAHAYADAVATFLGLGVGRCANYWSALTPWGGEFIVQTFGRQALPMVWDYAEGNPFSDSTGNWTGAIEWIQRVLSTSLSGNAAALVYQHDAQTQTFSRLNVVSTDPPYYDNIAYADLSDFFYVWLRRSLKPIFPSLMKTIGVPKAEELVATPYRHGGKSGAEQFFFDGMRRALGQISTQAHPAFPITIYYAFKQSESREGEGTSSTGWETFLSALVSAGMQVVGTWPMRTERDQGLKTGSNVLASSIVLVCRRRSLDALSISRREFVRELNRVLPEALHDMTKGAGEDSAPVAPVDLSQAIIGPGMAVFSKHAGVLEADGSPMSVKTALQLINRFLANDDFDADTQFCLNWFEEHGWSEGGFGQADVLARSKSTSVEGITEAGVIISGAGKVRLLKWNEYPSDWDPRTDKRIPVWEALHHLVRALRVEGESAAGALLGILQDKLEPVRQLAYRLFTLCERKGWSEDARAYNELIASWNEIEGISVALAPTDKQFHLFGDLS